MQLLFESSISSRVAFINPKKKLMVSLDWPGEINTFEEIEDEEGMLLVLDKEDKLRTT